MAGAYDVVVVGAGIGGLTVAALLSARGLSVCVLERQSQVGGCIGRVEFSGLEFEPGMGLYTSFGANEIYQRIFAELPVDLPETSLVTQPYVVRTADGADVKLLSDDRSFPQFSSPVAMAALATARGPLYEIRGGPATIAERLAEAIKASGGAVRLNTPVLRLAYDSSGAAIGVDLLSGETVRAKVIVSNLTIWDTYGKLVGLNRTPTETRKLINSFHGSGAFVVYATIEAAAVARLPGERLLVAARATDDADNAFTEFTIAVGDGTATLTSATDVNEWFTYHASEQDFEESEQAALERFWTKLHAAVPELGGDIEIVETANPRTYYELTRRKLGMVLGSQSAPAPRLAQFPGFQTSIPNLFIISDTISPSPDLASMAQTALALADSLSTRQ